MRAAPATLAAGFECLLGSSASWRSPPPFRYYFVSWLGERTVADIRLAVHRNLLRLSPGFFEENRPAEITSRITVDTTIIEQVVGTTVSVALRNMRHGNRLRGHHVRARRQARWLADPGRRCARGRTDHDPRRAACARSRRAARTASPTSARSASEVLGAMKIVQAFNQQDARTNALRRSRRARLLRPPAAHPACARFMTGIVDRR